MVCYEYYGMFNILSNFRFYFTFLWYGLLILVAQFYPLGVCWVMWPTLGAPDHFYPFLSLSGVLRCTVPPPTALTCILINILNLLALYANFRHLHGMVLPKFEIINIWNINPKYKNNCNLHIFYSAVWSNFRCIFWWGMVKFLKFEKKSCDVSSFFFLSVQHVASFSCLSFKFWLSVLWI